VAAGEDSEH